MLPVSSNSKFIVLVAVGEIQVEVADTVRTLASNDVVATENKTKAQFSPRLIDLYAHSMSSHCCRRYRSRWHRLQHVILPHAVHTAPNKNLSSVHLISLL